MMEIYNYIFMTQLLFEHDRQYVNAMYATRIFSRKNIYNSVK